MILIIGESSFRSLALSIYFIHKRVCVLLPVPDSPKKSAHLPSATTAEECMAMALFALSTTPNITHNPKRRMAISMLLLRVMLVSTTPVAVSI
jgi:hypothetical protein